MQLLDDKIASGDELITIDATLKNILHSNLENNISQLN